MDKKITPDQINALYAFTRAHFVEYYDLQTELVDHLANAIEGIWQQRPNVSFEEALSVEFKKFGIFGFSDVVEQRQKALGKKYYRLMWRYFTHFFKLPHLVLTLGVSFATYKLLEFEPTFFVYLQMVVIIAIIYKTTAYKRLYNKKIKDSGRRWLFEEIIYNCGGIFGFIGIPLQFFQFTFKDHASFTVICLLSTFLVLTGLLSYVMLFIIPAKAEEHLKATYPEYNLEISGQKL